MIVVPGFNQRILALIEAGFIATNTSQRSPVVCTGLCPKCTWNPDTPDTVPCGGRISAG